MTTTYTIHGKMTITTEEAHIAEEFARCGMKVTARVRGER